MARTAIKFGLFVLVCSFFTLYLAFTIGNIKVRDLNPFGDDNFTLTAAFGDVSGLLKNDEVKIAGVSVGKVTDITVEHGRAVVTFQVETTYRDRLSADTHAEIRWRNLIGQRYLYLVPGSDAIQVTGPGHTLQPGDRVSCPREDGPECQNKSVADLGALFNTLGPIVETIDEGQVNDFLTTMTQALDGNADRIGQALTDLAHVSSALATRDDSISRLIENVNTVAGTITARDQQIRTMLDNLVLLSQTFSDNTQVVDDALREFGSFSTDLSSLVAANRAELDRIIANLDTTVNDTVVPRLQELDTALAGLDETSRAIFNVGRNGQWLNETILCTSVTPPPCATPIIPNLGTILGTSATTSSDPVVNLTNLVLGPAGGAR